MVWKCYAAARCPVVHSETALNQSSLLPSFIPSISSPPLLDPQIGRNWRPLQRSMSRADPEREGALPTKVFFDILQSNGIQLSPRQQIQVQEVLDPGLTDTINYHEFFKAFLG